MAAAKCCRGRHSVSPSTERWRWLGARRKSVLLPAGVGMIACAALIVPIKVPRELSERTSLELSGAVWSSALSRYLLVSAELNDPESITAAPDGTLFVCTSHSPNKKGHVPESRRRLLQLAITPDRKAKVLGHLDLSVARGADGKPPWGAGSLDIEGLAFRDGALFMGLKSPLGSDGSAAILRLPDALAAIQSGVIQDGALSVWSRTRLCVPHAGKSVCEGISDLAFLPNGSLLVTGNAPKGMPTDGGGSLWKLAAPNGAPTLLKRFEGLKPEGVALSPDRVSAIVVFDTDGKEPLWIRWPL